MLIPIDPASVGKPAHRSIRLDNAILVYIVRVFPGRACHGLRHALAIVGMDGAQKLFIVGE